MMKALLISAAPEAHCKISVHNINRGRNDMESRPV